MEFSTDLESESESEEYVAPLCLSCGKDDDLIDNMYCVDCYKRQRFLHIFNQSKTYELGAYFGKHLFEKYLGYYVSEQIFISYMVLRGYKFNEKTRMFRVKLNKRNVLDILGIAI